MQPKWTGSATAAVRRPAGPVAAAGALLGAGVAWALWPTLRGVESRWSTDPRYAHGYVVLGFVLLLLWLRRRDFPASRLRPSWWGVAAVAAGAALYLAGGALALGWSEGLSLLAFLAGLCLATGGRPLLAWALPAVGFLVFLLPLPYRVETAMSQPLQRFATKTGTYAIQTLGFPAAAEGNVIRLDGGPIGVAEACSGLGMLFTFVATSAGAALLLKRPWPDKALVLLASVPIAVAANVSRIVGTGVVHECVSPAASERFHDVSGWLMMPVALALLFVVLKAADLLIVRGPSPAPTPTPAPAPSVTKPATAAATAPAVARPNRGKPGPWPTPDDFIKGSLRP